MFKRMMFCLLAIALVGAASFAAASSIGWGNLQWPPTLTDPACTGEAIYGQVWMDGVTTVVGQGAGIAAELGFGPVGSTPDETWTWFPAVFNVDSGNNDEYMVQMNWYLPLGTYDFTFRYQYVGDSDWYVAAERGVATIDQTCGTVATEPTTWGAVKAMY